MANQNKNLNQKDDLDNEELEIAKTFEESESHQALANENVTISKSKLVLMKKLLNNIKENNERMAHLLSAFVSAEEEEKISIGQIGDDRFDLNDEDLEGKIIEGVFDGENMIGPDGKQYSIPANYASKSKLVEGDILKLTITNNGTFIYKQIGPIERCRIVGKLEKEVNNDFYAIADGRKWRVLTASVTYYKGEVGDEVVILVPKSGESNWAAVENIVKTVI